MILLLFFLRFSFRGCCCCARGRRRHRSSVSGRRRGRGRWMDEPLEERPDLRPPPSESHPVLLEPREVAVPVRGCHEKGEQQVHRDLANERARVSVESLDLRVRVRVQSPVAGRAQNVRSNPRCKRSLGRRFCEPTFRRDFPSLTRTLGPCTTGKSRACVSSPPRCCPPGNAVSCPYRERERENRITVWRGSLPLNSSPPHSDLRTFRRCPTVAAVRRPHSRQSACSKSRARPGRTRTPARPPGRASTRVPSRRQLACTETPPPTTTAPSRTAPVYH